MFQLALTLCLLQSPFATTQVDRSRPVPPKDSTLAAWRRRQSAITTFQFSWTERQTYPVGWLPNPRYPERERARLPALHRDRTYTVAKSLAVDGNKMRYTFELDRPEEPDGVRVTSPSGDTRGLGVHRHYTYVSVFDGTRGEVRMTTFLDSPPPTAQPTTSNVDAQNLDLRPILMALRPLDAVMGHLLIDRAVTNERRTFYRGKSTFLLEERHDPSGWKTILWIEPERDYLVSRYGVEFEQKPIVDIDIDYTRDRAWGWIPTGWRITALLANGTRRLVTEAHVTKYSINAATDSTSFSPGPPSP